MTPKRIARESEHLATDDARESLSLLRRAEFEAALHDKVTKSVGHERESLGENGAEDDFPVFSGTRLELLLQKNGGLLIRMLDDSMYENLKGREIIIKLLRINNSTRPMINSILVSI